MHSPISFRENLRRTLLLYGMIPLLSAALLLFTVLGAILIRNVINGSREDCSAAVALLTETARTMEQKLDELFVTPPPDVADRSGFAAFSADIYRFINRTDASPLFLLTDEEDNPLFITRKSLSTPERLLVYWRALRPLRQTGRVSRMVRMVDGDGTVLTGWLIGRTLPGGRHAVFLISSGRLHAMLSGLASPIVLTDRMDHVVLDATEALTGSFGKLRTALPLTDRFVTISSETYFSACYDGEKLPCRLFAIRPCGSLLHTLLFSLAVVLGIFICMMITLYFATDIIARKKTATVDQIATFCAEVQAGEIDKRLCIPGEDELAVIGSACNDMLDSLRDLMNRSVALSQEKNISRIKQLETEFNPHFLFNTLENIRYMIRLDSKAAESMIRNLSSLLRYSLEMNEDTVPLARDLGYTGNYLHILELRFGNRLSWNMDVAEELMTAQIPRLIMQPIIENAVKYSMDAKNAVHIDIRVEKSGGELLITVSDSGPGIGAERLQTVHDLLQNKTPQISGHVGIRNVHERIRLMYGDDYGICTIDTGPEGTVIRMRMPMGGEQA